MELHKIRLNRELNHVVYLAPHLNAFILAGDLESGLDHAPTQGLPIRPRVPFEPITNQASTTASRRTTFNRTKPGNTHLLSSAISKQKLESASDVILKYPIFRSPSSVGTLVAKLAREAFLARF